MEAKNPADQIKTRDAWTVLNRVIQDAIVCHKDSKIAFELVAFKSDLNVALHQKFGVLEEKKNGNRD